MENDNKQSDQVNNEINNEKIEEQPAKKENGSKNKPRFVGITSGIIGGVISAIIVVLLFTSNIIPFNQTEEGTSMPVTTDENVNPPITETLASEDNAPASIDELSKAVVGVVNLQQQNIWTPSQAAGTGSGIIYKKENGKAYVVTNNHVVNGAEEVEVNLNNDERVKAKVLGTDALTDLAVLEIDGSNIDVVANLGSSKDLHVGDTVIAIGNPLSMDFSGTVTKGIISGLDRSIEVDTSGDGQTDWVTEVIQTDAAINPGNSGGALVNTNGEVVGINSMKIARNTVEGIGFAIPMDSALPIMEQLKTKGEVARPYIGISTVELNQVPQQYRSEISVPEDKQNGMVVANVQTGSPADQAGLKQFDVITNINDHEITSLLDLRKYLYSETAIGDEVNIDIFRDGKQQTVELTLTDRDI